MKKLSRIFVLLCLLMALVCAISITAFAEETEAIVVDRIDLYCPEPMLGEDPYDYGRRITYNQQGAYTISIAGVGTNSGSWTEGFTQASFFLYNIRITANTGYTFKSTPVYVNDAPTGKSVTGYLTVFSYYALIDEPLEHADIPAWPTDLQPGQAAGEGTLSLPEDSKIIVTYKWTAYRDPYLYSTPITTLENGKLYTLHYNVKPAAGYYFSDDTQFTIGGEAAECNSRFFEAEFKKDFGVNVTYIDTFDITYQPPRLGDAYADFTVSADNAVRITSYQIQPSNKTAFEEGVEHSLYISTEVNTGYAFADSVTVTFNGGSPQTFDTSHCRTFLTSIPHAVVIAQPVPEVAFPAWPENVVPGPGGRTDIETPEDAEYDLQQVWMDLRTGEIVDTLVAGDVYTLAYIATPKHGYFFREETTYTHAGEPCEPMGEDQYRVIYKSYDLGAKKIERIDVTLPTIIKGCTLGNVKVSASADYTLMETLWAESATGNFADANPVTALDFGTTGYVIPVLVSKAGYAFSDDVALYINGKEVTVEYIYNEGAILEIAGICGTLTPPTGTGWYREDNTWAYYENGTKAVSRWIRDSIDWCYVDASGLMVKNGWAKDSAGWCYLGSSGYMVRSKWILWEGDYYYLNAKGYMLSNTWMRDSKDWCYLGKDGKMLTNAWQKDSKGWCYVGADGYMIRNGWAVDSVGICRLGGDGYMVYNQWVKDSDGWRYVGSNGYMVYNDWALWNGYWYAFDEYGIMFSSTAITYKGKIYYLDANGRMLTNAWFKVGNYWSYAGADGAVPINTWVKDSKGWCYIGSGGAMLTDSWITENGKEYYVDSNGYMLRNTTRTFYSGYPISRPYTYYFDSNGVATYQSPF